MTGRPRHVSDGYAATLVLITVACALLLLAAAAWTTAFRQPVGCQNPATASEQRFQAAALYSLIKPPRMGCRRILARMGSGTGASGRGGRRSSARCGRAVL
jgi:hypothetical protein